MGGGAQRLVWRVNVEPKKSGARCARARTRGQNPLVSNISIQLIVTSFPGENDEGRDHDDQLSTTGWSPQLFPIHHLQPSYYRSSAPQSTYFTVRGQSYFSRLPKYRPPPIPLSARRVRTPRLCCGGRIDSPGGEGDGGSIFWKTREIGLPSYSKICTLCSALSALNFFIHINTSTRYGCCCRQWIHWYMHMQIADKGYSDFNNLMSSPAKSCQIIVLKMFVKNVFQLVEQFLRICILRDSKTYSISTQWTLKKLITPKNASFYADFKSVEIIGNKCT